MVLQVRFGIMGEKKGMLQNIEANGQYPDRKKGQQLGGKMVVGMRIFLLCEGVVCSNVAS